jgi:phage head maturation protease
MKIVAVKKDSKGVIQEYKLDNNRTVDVTNAIQMVKNGQIEGCNVFTTRSGSEAIRSNNDGDTSNNLDSLPRF